MPLYQIGFVGHSNPALRSILERGLNDHVHELGLAIGSDVELVNSIPELLKASTASKVAVYFGQDGAKDLPDTIALVESGIPVLPIAPGAAKFNEQIPPLLQHIGGLTVGPDKEQSFLRIGTCILECLGLLRTQRDVFVSYRRTEAREAAVQLHDSLSARQFDAYLDTHDVRPGEDFQEQLWHRLSDCDVLLMLDTPRYFDSRWTAEEFGRAEAKALAILRVGWPGHKASRVLQLGEDLQLEPRDIDTTGRLNDDAIHRIVCAVERLRAKSIAVRHEILSSAFMNAIQFLGGRVHGASIGRTISATLSDGRTVLGVPAIGIPTSETLHHVALSTAQATGSQGIIIYDHVGLHPKYIEHLKWLHNYVKDVHWVWQANAHTDLARL